MKLENVVGLVGGLSALAGAFLPVVTRASDGAAITALEAGGIAWALLLLAAFGILVSIAALAGKTRSEERMQIATGVLGLLAAFLFYRQAHAALGAGVSAGWGAQLLFWGFAMLVLEGLINFSEARPRLGASA